MKKKILAMMLSMVMVVSSSSIAYAAEVTPAAATDAEETTVTEENVTDDAAVEETATEEATKEEIDGESEEVAVPEEAEDKTNKEIEEATEEETSEEETSEDAETTEEVDPDEALLDGSMSVDAMNAGSGNFSSLGSPLTWSVSGSTLTISGNGAMPDYNSGDGNWTAFINACNGINRIVVAEGVTKISAYAFAGAGYAAFRNVTSVSLPSTLTDIGAFAFNGDTGLTSVTIPSGNVHESAFINCTNLQTVELGSGVKEVGVSAFEGCGKISRVQTPSLNAWCNIYFGGIKANPTEVSHNLYVGGTLLTNLAVPSGVKEISPYAFQGVTSITQVSIPASVKEIGEYAFHGCSGIQFVTFSGAGIQSIGAYAFEAIGNSSFIDLSIPASIEYIGEYAFANNKLQTISVPKGFIANYAFRYNALMFASIGPSAIIAEHALDGINTEVLRHDLPSTSYTVPNTVTLGRWQNAPISWNILTVSGGKALLVSSEVLDYQKFYNSQNQTGKWASSDIHSWLNGTFYTNAFSSTEKNNIATTTVTDSRNSKYGTSIGATTSDKVFLLSEEEVKQYMPRADLRVAPASAYCQGANSNPARYNGAREDKSAYYWLRTPGISAEYAAFVGYNGTISYDGAYTSNPQIFGVRPAIWVDASVVRNVATTKTKTFAGITSTNWKREAYAFVQRLYTLVLNRTPDAAGWQDWEQQLENGRNDGAGVARGFFLSTEMLNRNLSNEEYVEILYLVMMNRGSDPAGKAYWVEALDSGVTYEGVLKGFAESDEFTEICQNYKINRGSIPVSHPLDVNQGVTKFAARCYTKTLGRKYDEEGLINWVNYINNSANPRQTAIDVSTNQFFHSQEFMNKNTTDEQFVDILYASFLGRNPDPNGRADWVKQLKEGASRDQIMAGFYKSQEFDGIMRSYGL